MKRLVCSFRHSLQILGISVLGSCLFPTIVNAMQDCTTGRWITRDPIGYRGGSPNLYEFEAASPTDQKDPYGLETFQQFIERDPAVRKTLEEMWDDSKIDGGAPVEWGFWYYHDSRFGLRGIPERGRGDGVWPSEHKHTGHTDIGFVHTHPKKKHDHHQSDQDERYVKGQKGGYKNGVVLVRDEALDCGEPHKGDHYERTPAGDCITVKGPPRYKLVFFGDDKDKDIPCEKLYGKPPLLKHWELDKNKLCVLRDDSTPPDFRPGVAFASPESCRR